VDFNSVQFFRRFLPSWSNDAACAGTDTNTFFPEDDRAANDDVVLKARVVCARCPMRAPCLEWALENIHSAEHGIYAGTTGEERKQAIKDGTVDRLLEGALNVSTA
jgi:WhiB family transcriptional regulator, redox-sensing transcriptional regulator